MGYALTTVFSFRQTNILEKENHFQHVNDLYCLVMEKMFKEIKKFKTTTGIRYIELNLGNCERVTNSGILMIVNGLFRLIQREAI